MNVRPLERADAADVAAIARADEQGLGRASRLEPDDVLAWWSLVDLGRDSWLIEEGGQKLAAGWLVRSGDVGDFAGVVALGAKGRGLGTALVERAESRARERGVACLRIPILPEDAAAAALLRDRGYADVRRFYEMAIELDAEPTQTEVPDGLVLDAFREQDARAFHAAIVEAFERNWDFRSLPFEPWWEMRRGQHADERGPLWFVVRDEEEIAAVVRNEARRSGGGFVGMLGVRPAWRARGLGRALLMRSFAEFWARGTTRVALGVDSENATGATALYESVGMHVESVTAVFERTLGWSGPGPGAQPPAAGAGLS